MNVISFADRSNRSQIATLRPYAEKFARDFGLNATEIKIANHAFNSTFKISTPQGDYALRINTHSIRSAENLRAEIAWTSQLANTPVSAARPHKAPSGDYILQDRLPGHPRPISAVCYHWLPGRQMPAIPTQNLYNSLATLTANLHKNPPKLPTNASLEPLTDCLHNYEFRFPNHGYPDNLDLFQEIRDNANATLAKLAKIQPPQVIHYDLHRFNLKRQGNQIHVLDFDDCLIASPLMDTAITFYYFRRFAQCTALELGFWRTYGFHYRDLGVTDREFEALITGRRLFLINEFVHLPLAKMQAIFPAWYAKSVEQFHHFLKTGAYTHEP